MCRFSLKLWYTHYKRTGTTKIVTFFLIGRLQFRRSGKVTQVSLQSFLSTIFMSIFLIKLDIFWIFYIIYLKKENFILHSCFILLKVNLVVITKHLCNVWTDKLLPQGVVTLTTVIVLLKKNGPIMPNVDIPHHTVPLISLNGVQLLHEVNKNFCQYFKVGFT